MFSGVLNMTSFKNRMGHDATDPGTQGWLVAILELGAWFGVLVSGYLADKLSRKYTIVSGECFVRKAAGRPYTEGSAVLTCMWMSGDIAVGVFCIGVIVQTTAFHPSSIFGGENPGSIPV